jgi:uncharacterized protein
MTTGGDWKELVRAASDGDDKAVQSLLFTIGVNPNYQHPEYMTTPLLEAIRHKQYTTVKLLLSGSGSIGNSTSTCTGNRTIQANDKLKSHVRVVLSDPTIAGDLDGQTPIELALELKDHKMVDIVLQYLEASNNQIRYCKTILMTGSRYRYDLVKYILNLGHCVIVVIDNNDDKNSTQSSNNNNPNRNHDDHTSKEFCNGLPVEQEETKLRTETGNKKVWFLSHISQLKDILHNNRHQTTIQKDVTTLTTTMVTTQTESSLDSTTDSYMYIPTMLDIWIHTMSSIAQTTTNSTFLDDIATHLPSTEYFSSSLVGMNDTDTNNSIVHQKNESTPIPYLLLLESKCPNSPMIDSKVQTALSWLFSNVNQSLITIFAIKIHDASTVSTSSSGPFSSWFWTRLMMNINNKTVSSMWCQSIGRLLGLEQTVTTTDQFFATVPTKNEIGVHGHVYTTNLFQILLPTQQQECNTTLSTTTRTKNHVIDTTPTQHQQHKVQQQHEQQKHSEENDWIQKLDSILLHSNKTI